MEIDKVLDYAVQTDSALSKYVCKCCTNNGADVFVSVYSPCLSSISDSRNRSALLGFIFRQHFAFTSEEWPIHNGVRAFTRTLTPHTNSDLKSVQQYRDEYDKNYKIFFALGYTPMRLYAKQDACVVDELIVPFYVYAHASCEGDQLTCCTRRCPQAKTLHALRTAWTSLANRDICYKDSNPTNIFVDFTNDPENVAIYFIDLDPSWIVSRKDWDAEDRMKVVEFFRTQASSDSKNAESCHEVIARLLTSEVATADTLCSEWLGNVARSIPHGELAWLSTGMDALDNSHLTGSPPEHNVHVEMPPAPKKKKNKTREH